MSDDFETLVAHGKALYGDLVARSWEILVAQTDATSPAAIEATCDLQRNLVVAGAEWIALCERVLALSTTAGATTAAFAPRVRVTGAVDSAIASQALEASSPALPVERSQPARTRSQARIDVALADQSATMLPIPSPESNGAGSPRTASVPSNGQAAYRIFPLILDGAPAHVQLVAMSFNGAEWHPIAAWRRIYQQVIQSLQRSDPERFDTLATTLTMSNGRPLFSRDRSVYMAPIDAGGGWFATGQMPTELILQRLRMLVDWWGLPRESLSVEVMPEARAPVVAGPNDEQRVSNGDTTLPLIAPELEPSIAVRADDARSYTEEAPPASLEQAEPVDVESAVSTTDPATAAPDSISMNGNVSEAVTVSDVATASIAEAEAQSVAVVDVPMELIASGSLNGVVVESASGEIDHAVAPSDTVEAPIAETNAVLGEATSAVADVSVPEEVPDDVSTEDEGMIAAQPSEETLAEALPPAVVDTATAETIEVAAAPATEPGEAKPEPVSDPVNGMEAHVIQTAHAGAPASANEVVQPPHVLPAAQPHVAFVEEFTPPPTATPSNVRWVKTINGTRLPLRPATDD